MNSVLRKRLPRDLRAGFGRYLALTLLIVMGIYLVVGIVGAAETVIRGTDSMKSVNKVEDGQFTVFLPLTDAELDKLSSDGTVIEPMFSLDLKAEDGSVLRMFKNRSDIDLIQLDTGRLAETEHEAVIEKGYAEAHSLTVGDKLNVSGAELEIVGIGSVPDYDQTLASFGDTAVERSSFGLIFVSDEQYGYLRDNTSQKAEEYTYAYRLGSISDDELKDKIKDLGFDYTKVENKYFKQTIDEILDKRREIEDGVSELADGSRELSDGLRELDDNSDKLRDAADELLHEYLVQANGTISLLGGERLTEENYSDELEKLIAKNDDYAEDLTELRDSLDGLVQFRDGIGEYTDGVLEARNCSVELANGMDDLDSETVKLLDEVFDIDIDNLTSFVTAEDNIRIGAAAGDVIMDKNAGLVAGVIILVLFAYVISVFVVHQIEREQSVIGALYALGVRKKDLLWHYITLPTIVAFVGGLIGAALGFSPIGIGTQTADTYGYFSVPEFDVVYPVYLIVYAVVLPPVICAAVNALVINKKLSQTALSLIKNEQSAGSYKQVRLRTKSFTRLFAIRQLMRESRSAITVTLGMLVSLLVVMLGLDCYVMCNAVNRNTIADTHYEYMYLYKYPEEKAPGGEQAYIETLSTDCMGYTLDVTVIGLDGESKYFSARPEKGRSKAVINNSLVERYGYKVGDRVTFTDEAADTDYSFTVTGVCDYSPGFTIFMDIESMRELFGKEEDYFNAVYSDEELDIDEGRLYSVTTKADVEKSAGVFIEQMSSLIIVLMAAGAIIFCVVMYLMLGVMIDRSAMGISLIKIFGYRPNEIRQLYLNGNLAVIAVGGLITIPLAKLSMDAIYPSFIPNVACSMKLEFPWYLYLLIYSAVLIIYLIINAILVRKIRKISPAEVLKNRE